LQAGAEGDDLTAEKNYIGATTSWVDVGENTQAFLAMPKAGTEPFAAVIIGHERYGLVQHTLDLAPSGPLLATCVSRRTWRHTGWATRRR
jgi:hypothetical protein